MQTNIEPVNTLKDASNFKLQNIRKHLKDNVKAHAKNIVNILILYM